MNEQERALRRLTDNAKECLRRILAVRNDGQGRVGLRRAGGSAGGDKVQWFTGPRGQAMWGVASLSPA